MIQLKRFHQRVLSLFLVLAAVLFLLPTPAKAAVTTGTGIAATTDANRWSTRLNAHGQPYTYKSPVINGKYLYCVDRGYSWRWGNPSFTGSYTYKYAIGADTDAVLADAIASSGLGEASAEALENIKWMASYVNDYTGEIPGALFMAVQTYIWDNQSDKTASGDTSGDIDAGGYANADTYDIYLGYIDFMLGEKAKEDAKLQQQLEEYNSQGISAAIVEDESQKWAMLASSNVSGRQHFFTYHFSRKVVTTSEPNPGEPDQPDIPDIPDPPPEGSGTITLKKVIEGTTRGLDGAVFNIYFNGQIVGSDVTSNGGTITVEDAETGLWSFVEVSAPEGYAADHTPHSVYVDVSEGDKEYTVSASNAALPGLRISKTDAQSGNPVPNTVFSVKSVTGSFSTTVTTGGNGTGTLLDLEPGVYVVREESVPEPYILNQTEQTVALQPGKTSEAAFTNYKKPGLEILKKSMASGGPISGVTFLVEQIDGGYSKSATTDHSGRIFLENIPAGSYKITETAVPEDVIISELPQAVDLEPGSTATVTFRNARKSAVTIRKTDAQTGDPVPGVTYTLNKVDGATITTEPTGPDGTVTISLLEPGVYTITEQNVPEPYILDTTPQQITLFPDRNASVEFQNYKKPELTLSKIDADSGDPIPKTIFTVKGIDNDYQDEWTTGSDGKVSLRVPAGTYQVTEKSVPAPYYLPDKDADRVQTISLNPGDEKTLVFQNHRAPELTIYKEDSVAGAPIEGAKFHVAYTSSGEASGAPASMDFGQFITDSRGEIRLHEQGKKLYPGEYTVTEVEPAPGFQMKEPTTQRIIIHGGERRTLVFQNEPLNGIVVEKYDSVSHEALPGCTFQLRYLGGTSGTGGTIIGQKVTGKNGTAIWTGLKSGAYIVEETDPADGYSIIQASETVYISDNGTQDVITLRFENSPDGILLIRKVCATNPSVTLQNAEFKITYADGTLIGDSNGVYRTDENGEIRVPGLKPGKSVVVTETKAPNGFIIDTQSQTVQIKEGRTVSLTFKNQPRGSLIIQKRDSQTNDVLPGAEFRITTAAGCEVGLDGVIGTSTLTQNGIFTTDAQGEIKITNLAPGAYVINEIKAPDGGYVIDTPSTNVVIGQGGDTQTVVIKNTRKGGLIIEKYDSVSKQPLSGAQFKVTTANGELVPDNEGLTSSNGLYTSDINGQIVLSKLLPGAYVVSEEKAPDNYRKDPAPQTVVVNAGDTQTIRFYDDPLCALTILKRDAVTKKPLKGAEFLVRDSSGHVIGPNNGLYTTGTDGTVTVTGLAPNSTVVVSEKKAPKGYVLDETPQNIVVRTGVANGLIFDDEPGTTLIIRKFIEGTENEPLSGVAFKVVDGSGAAVGPDDGVYYTDKAGEIVLEGIEPGTTVIAREIKTAEGFVLDGTPQDILIKGGEVQQLTFWNKRAGTLVIQKKDKVSGSLIAGAEFQLTYASGGYVDSDNGHLSSKGIYITNDKGEIRIDGITGTVVVKESKAAPGYVIDQSTQTQTVTVHPMDTQTLTFLNEPLCSLTITKLDSISGKPVPNTEFTLKDGNGNIIGRCVTGADGTATVTGLIPNSTVVVVESRVPSNYVLDTTPHTLIVRNGSNSVTSGGSGGSTGGVGNSGTVSGGNDLTIENDPKMTLTIKKYIKGTNYEPLAGVCFKVVDGAGKPVGSGDGTFYTNSAGEIVVEGLEPGTTVTAREISTVKGFVLDGEPKSVQIKASDKAPELILWNEKAGSLVIQKKNSLDGSPLAGVQFLLTYADGSYVDADNGHMSNKGLYETDSAGEIRITGITGTVIAKEVKCLPGFTIDPAASSQTVQINPDDCQTLVFYNTPIGNFELIKVSTSDAAKRIPNVTFEIRRASDGGLVDMITTGSDGRAALQLDAGDYYAVETECPKEFKLDSTPHYFTMRDDGKGTTLTVKNEAFSGILIHKIDSATKEGIYGVSFALYDSTNKPVGQYTSDDKGYVYIDDITKSGRYYLRELENEGYIVDTQMKTIYVSDGETTLVEWENTPITGQIQITKTSADYNSMNGWTAGTPIPNTEFEIYHYRTGNLVDTIRTDKNGVAVSKPLPLGRYKVVESKAAEFYGLDKTPIEVEIEYAGQIVRAAMTNKALYTNVAIKKTGFAEVMPGQQIRYDFSGIANNSTTTLTSFYWRDTLPTQAVRLDKIFTGTYNVQGNYKVVYKTNLNGEYRTMYDNLSAQQSYLLDASPAALGLASNECVTEFMFSFGVVPGNFRQVEAPKVYCNVLPGLIGGAQFANQADVGGVYNGQWIMAASRWVTKVYKPSKPLPKTGY